MAPVLLGLGTAAPPAATDKTFYTAANTDTLLASGSAIYTEYFDIMTKSAQKSCYIRLPNVTVPKDATIVSASVSWVVRWYDNYPAASYTDDAVDWLDYWVERVDNSLAPTTYAAFNTRVGSFSADKRLYKSGMNGGDSVRVAESDITSAIQALVNRASWASGNAVGIFTRNNAATANGLAGIPHQIATGDAQRPRLMVSYY